MSNDNQLKSTVVTAVAVAAAAAVGYALFVQRTTETAAPEPKDGPASASASAASGKPVMNAARGNRRRSIAEQMMAVLSPITGGTFGHTPLPGADASSTSPRGFGTGSDAAPAGDRGRLVNPPLQRSSSVRAALIASGTSESVEQLEDPWAGDVGAHGFKFGAGNSRAEHDAATAVSSASSGNHHMTIQQMVRLEVPRLQDLCPQFETKTPNLREPLPCYAVTGEDLLLSPPSMAHGHTTSFERIPDNLQTEDGGTGADGGDVYASRGVINVRSQRVPYVNYVDESYVILGDIVRHEHQKAISRAYIRAGPRATTYFDPHKVRAAIVTCGGLCPGLNNVVREIVMTLHNSYGADKVYGVKHGYWGFHTLDADPENHAKGNPNVPLDEPAVLTPASVASIHNLGGTILGSDRGGHDAEVILRFCANRGINQLYIIGGDGTHRGAHAVAMQAVEQRLPIAVAAIPKTIDNDVDIIDRSFGFDTAFAAAEKAIKSAKTEASGAVNGLGIVKVMGRYAGFIAAHSTMASGDVDLCLIPEVPLTLDGPASILAHILATIRRQGHAVVVVAEGAGEDMMDEEIVKAGGKVEFDAGGNRKLPPIGPWLQSKFQKYLEAHGLKPSIKYIDPSYMIRSVPANAADAVYCTLLAQNAVHGAMAGFSAFSTGLVNNRLVYLPITAITANSPRRMNPRGRTYERLLQLTRQPDPLAFPKYYNIGKEEKTAPKEAS